MLFLCSNEKKKKKYKQKSRQKFIKYKANIALWCYTSRWHHRKEKFYQRNKKNKEENNFFKKILMNEFSRKPAFHSWKIIKYMHSICIMQCTKISGVITQKQIVWNSHRNRVIAVQKLKENTEPVSVHSST
jgi:hypothetical protein